MDTAALWKGGFEIVMGLRKGERERWLERMTLIQKERRKEKREKGRKGEKDRKTVIRDIERERKG